MIGKVVSLLSAGLDSPVASHLLSDVGAEVNLLSLDSGPFTGKKTMQVVDELVERLQELHPDIRAYRADFSMIQGAIADKVEGGYRCIICRRMMYRVAEKLAEDIGAEGIATGESLGQVASQTLSNIGSEDCMIDLPIYRPLIGLDKMKITDIAREIGTYEISIQPSVCCLLTPDNPKVRSKKEKVKKEEENMDIEALLDRVSFREL